MLEPPSLCSEQLTTCIHAAYDLTITEIAFLPLGADPDTAVYCRAASLAQLAGQFEPGSVTEIALQTEHT